MKSAAKASTNPFLKMMQRLLLHNELVLYGLVLEVDEDQVLEVIVLLYEIYNVESKNFRGEAPKFDKEAAKWSSKILFHAAQFLMYRDHKPELLENFFVPYAFEGCSHSDGRYLPSIYT